MWRNETSLHSYQCSVVMASVCQLCRAKASPTHYCPLVISLEVQCKLRPRLENLLDVDVDTNDGLPHIICHKCKRHFETLEKASPFREPGYATSSHLTIPLIIVNTSTKIKQLGYIHQHKDLAICQYHF